MDHIQVQILRTKFHHCLFTFSVKCEIKHLQSRSCAKTAKKCTKKCDTREKLKFCLLKPFFTVLLPLHCWIFKSPKFPVNQEEVMLFDVGVKWMCMFDGKANNNLQWFFFLHTIVSNLEKPLLAGYALVSMMFSSPKC